VAVSAHVEGLSPNTTYHFRILATNSGGTSTGGDETFTTPPNPPGVTLVRPDAGPESGGTTVTITGTNLSEATSVKFGSTDATSFTVSSDTSITAVSPAGTAAVDVIVSTPGGISPIGPDDGFSYAARPTVTRVAPGNGPVDGGTTVSISGTHLNGATAVTFGSTGAAGFTANSATSISAVSPAKLAGGVTVSVATPGGTSASSSHDRFRFNPTIANLSPNTGSTAGGTAVNVTGTGFVLGTKATAFKFGSSTAAAVDCTSTTTCTVMSPAHVAGAVDLTATVNGVESRTTPVDQFTYS
jgi:IPT/TIG domain